MLCRFVKRDGWERWINVDDRCPPAWKVPDAFELPDRLFADPPEPAAALKIRLFCYQPWKVDGWPTEPVYVEDDMRLDDSDRFGPGRPSLHRERLYAEALRRIRDIVDQDVPTSAVGQLLVAAHKTDLIASELRRLPATLFTSQEKP